MFWLAAAVVRVRWCGTGPRHVVSAVLAGCEDDIDIGGCVLEVLHAQVGVGHLLLLDGGVVLVLLPWRWCDVVIFWRLSLVVLASKYNRQ